MTHPAYPSNSDLAREGAALRRDAADLATLARLRAILSLTIDGVEREDELRHPDVRWGVGDLAEVLHDALADLDATHAQIAQGELVLDEEWAA